MAPSVVWVMGQGSWVRWVMGQTEAETHGAEYRRPLEVRQRRRLENLAFYDFKSIHYKHTARLQLTDIAH